MPDLMLFFALYLASVFLFRVAVTYYALNAVFSPGPHPWVRVLARPFIMCASTEGRWKWAPLAWPAVVLHACWDAGLLAADWLAAVGRPRKRP